MREVSKKKKRENKRKIRNKGSFSTDYGVERKNADERNRENYTGRETYCKVDGELNNFLLI